MAILHTLKPIITTTPLSKSSHEIAFTFLLSHKDYIYKDFIHFSSNNPHLSLSEWKSNIPPIEHYDPLFKTTKNIFTQQVTFTITATIEPFTNQPTSIYLSYYQSSTKKMSIVSHELFFEKKAESITTADNDKSLNKDIKHVHIAIPHHNYIRTSLDTINSALYCFTQLPIIEKAPSSYMFLIALFLCISGMRCIYKSRVEQRHIIHILFYSVGIISLTVSPFFVYKSLLYYYRFSTVLS